MFCCIYGCIMIAYHYLPYACIKHFDTFVRESVDDKVMMDLNDQLDFFESWEIYGMVTQNFTVKIVIVL